MACYHLLLQVNNASSTLVPGEKPQRNEACLSLSSGLPGLNPISLPTEHRPTLPDGCLVTFILENTFLSSFHHRGRDTKISLASGLKKLAHWGPTVSLVQFQTLNSSDPETPVRGQSHCHSPRQKEGPAA